MSKREGLSQLDLCFVVDCTSSMTPFIQAAQRQAETILTTLAAQASADMSFAVVGYRDRGHEPVRAFGDLDLDRRVFILLEDAGALTPGAPPVAPAPAMAASMGVSHEELARSIDRLKKRKIVKDE